MTRIDPSLVPHDVAVIGSGYTAFAAALEARRQVGTVLLISFEPTLLWETTRAYQTGIGPAPHGALSGIVARMAESGVAADGTVDVGCAEIAATRELRDAGVDVLYWATPIAGHVDRGSLVSVLCAGKAESFPIVARAWIDASETGSLVRLVGGGEPPEPTSQRVAFATQSRRWAGDPDLPSSVGAIRRSVWESERFVDVESQPSGPSSILCYTRHQIAHVSESVRSIARLPLISHVSVRPFPVYAEETPRPAVPANVVCAVPGFAGTRAATLDGRARLGVEAAAMVELADAASVVPGTERYDVPPPVRDAAAGVVVAGVGTGGSMAAISAGRLGTDVAGYDELPFPGGIGTGGGMHRYYYGFPGGLQDEVDRLTLETMALFMPSPEPRIFHPEAKKLVLVELLAAVGARFTGSARLLSVDTEGGVVRSAVFADSTGRLLEASAPVWVDGTGDGDLSALAGARYRLGRVGDGVLHAYSQSAAFCKPDGEASVFSTTNFDAGFVDPTSSLDLTRARVEGVLQYEQPSYTESIRPLYFAPALGVRQGRQIECDYTVTIDDLFERRQFDDGVGFTGSAYDNHAVDYEFESRDTMFLVWGSQLYYASTASAFPLRCLLPTGLANVAIGCRSLGVSEEAHHSFRMMRDIQRVGEAAGTIAALAVRDARSIRDIPFDELRNALAPSGALTTGEPRGMFGIDMIAADLDTEFWKLPAPERMTRALEAVTTSSSARPEFGFDHGQNRSPDFALWYLYRNAGPSELAQLRLLVADSGENVSWLAAVVLASRGDAAAETRLVAAVEREEMGREYNSVQGDRKKLYNVKGVPRWWIAVVMLSHCGGETSLDVLARHAARPALPLNARTAVAMTVASIAERVTPSDRVRSAVDSITHDLLDRPLPYSTASPNRDPLTGEEDWRKLNTLKNIAPVRVEIDFAWQLHFAVARMRRLAGLGAESRSRAFLGDPRRSVRRAFEVEWGEVVSSEVSSRTR